MEFDNTQVFSVRGSDIGLYPYEVSTSNSETLCSHPVGTGQYADGFAGICVNLYHGVRLKQREHTVVISLVQLLMRNACL